MRLEDALVIREECAREIVATAIAVVMLVMSFILLLAINALQAWTRKRQGK